MRKGKSDDRLRILFYKIAAEGLRALKSASEGAEEKRVHILGENYWALISNIIISSLHCEVAWSWFLEILSSVMFV